MEVITSKLSELREKSARGKREAMEFVAENPFERTRRLFRLKLTLAAESRIAIVKSIPVFTGMSEETYTTIAKLLEEDEYRQGHKFFAQGDIGDSFYIVESGQVSVRMSSNGEPEHEVVQLGPGRYFGETALIQNDVRGASIYVISETSICLKMTKKAFLQMAMDLKAMRAERNAAVGRNAVDKVELFKKLSPEIKKNLVAALSQESFAATSMICRQGSIGDTFYIIAEGQCDVTADTPGIRSGQQHLTTLFVGDFFGAYMRHCIINETETLSYS